MIYLTDEERIRKKDAVEMRMVEDGENKQRETYRMQKYTIREMAGVVEASMKAQWYDGYIGMHMCWAERRRTFKKDMGSVGRG